MWTDKNFFTRAKYHFHSIFSSLCYYLHAATAIVYHCSVPLSHTTLETLTKTQQTANPLSDTLLSLGTEASHNHCRELWVTDKSTQMAVLTLFGGGIDRYLMHELHAVVQKEQTWMRALYHLRHALWVDGSKELDRSPREKLNEWEREERKRLAANAFKKFLPSEISLHVTVVGGDVTTVDDLIDGHVSIVYDHVITVCNHVIVIDGHVIIVEDHVILPLPLSFQTSSHMWWGQRTTLMQ